MARRVKTDAEYDEEIKKAKERVKALQAQKRRAEDIRKGEVNVVVIQKLREWNDSRKSPSAWDEGFADEIVKMLTAQENFQQRRKSILHTEESHSDPMYL